MVILCEAQQEHLYIVARGTFRQPQVAASNVAHPEQFNQRPASKVPVGRHHSIDEALWLDMMVEPEQLSQEVLEVEGIMLEVPCEIALQVASIGARSRPPERMDRLVAGEIVGAAEVVANSLQAARSREIAREGGICAESDGILNKQVCLLDSISIPAAKHGGQKFINDRHASHVPDIADVRPVGNVVDVVGDEARHLAE